MAFYMVGDIKEVQEKADKLAKEVAARRDDAKQGKVSCGLEQGCVWLCMQMWRRSQLPMNGGG